MTGDPVNDVRITSDGRVAVVDTCVVCGREHRHGAADAALAAGKRSSRVAHCPTPGVSEYVIQLADDADPPARWRRQFRDRGTAGGEEL